MVAQSVDSRIGLRAERRCLCCGGEEGLPGGSVKAETQQEQDKL